MALESAGLTAEATKRQKLSLLKEKIEQNEKAAIEGNVEWNTYEIDRVKFFKKQSDGYNALDLLKL